MNPRIAGSLFAAATLLFTANTFTRADEATAPPKAPFPYVMAKAYHVLPGTHNNESGYFSLVEGNDGKIYIGTAKYGENSFLVEFDPKTEKQRIVIDTNKVTKTNGKGYAAQSKIHTKNYVGPSGTVYVGSKEGYATQEEQAAHNIPPYPGGYVMTYDPKTNKATNHGMPWPGQGINDVIADEARGLMYIITCEDEYWMTYDMKTKKYRWLGPQLYKYASTKVDALGRANGIMKNYQMARYDPATNKLAKVDIVIDGEKLVAPGEKERDLWIPSWSITPDGKTAYLIRMSYPELYELDLTGDIDKPITGKMVGRFLDYKTTDCRSGLSIGPDGKVYAAIAAANDKKFGVAYQLNHIVRYDPATKMMTAFGAVTIENKNYFEFKGADGKPKPFTHGIVTQPDGALTPQYQHLGSIVAKDGTVYVLVLCPYTLLRIPPVALKAP